MNAGRKTKVRIDLRALRHNLKLLRALNEDRFFCPMVKADAYGHGAVEVSKLLETEGIQNLGVALLEEALELREAGIQKSKIFIFGAFQPDAADILIQNRFVPVINSLTQLGALAEKSKNRDLEIHLKFNTGMNRLGFELSEVAKIRRMLNNYANLKVTGLCTHLATAEDSRSSRGQTAKQLEQFNKIVSEINIQGLQLHVYNSAGLIAAKNRKWGSRPGISLYGFEPRAKGVRPIGLKPVMTFEAEVMNTRAIERGESVSYGAKWKAKKRSTIVTVAAGYADGVDRSLTNVGEFSYKGHRVKVRGRVCMDYTMLDVTHVVSRLGKGPADLNGQIVVLFGGDSDVSVEDWAQWAKTNVYEITTRIGARVPKVFEDDPSLD